ncbi:hypothetical protein G6011_05202 [Alternaria panax]|uniref:Uncharacterized protein n=1 Tax=Alternaria panax TaxID=48097 RepID=A0AAD4I827_9PLEO|nr:hypothetical protein G6011_05202 [Alternaria panax]
MDRALRNTKPIEQFLMEGMMKLKGDRKPTPEGNQVVQRMRQEFRDLDKAKKAFEAEKNVALPVENIVQDVFVQCELTDELLPGKGQLVSKAVDEGPMENNRTYINLEEKKARPKLHVAQKEHD